MENKPHKAGFVNILGKPNAGKSTLMNALMGEKISMITPKAQTTRHRIMGMMNDDDYQIVFSDTPGIITPKYELQRRMMQWVEISLEDADVVLFVTDIAEKHDENDVIERLKKVEAPIVLLINKIDTATAEQVAQKIEDWQTRLTPKAILPISALKNLNTKPVLDLILELLPEHPAYFPKDEMTDRTQRFFVSEIVREKIFMNYGQEIPYCCEVMVISFKESEDIIRISTEILVERPTQKSIVIGKKGEMLKKVGTEARLEMEAFFGKKVFLEQFVKVEPDWRNKKRFLENMGYVV